MKTTVIYHRADFDGIFCREIAKKFLPEAELIGWDYGDAKIDPLTLPKGIIYILDLSPECLEGTQNGEVLLRDRDLIWIDHHKSAIEKFSPEIPGYRIDGVAACRLTWQWFTCRTGNNYRSIMQWSPHKEGFVNRTVSEPLVVRLAGEYDIWDKRDPRAELFQHGLRSRELTDFDWAQMLSTERPSFEEIEKLVAMGVWDLLEPDGTFVNATLCGLLEGGKVLQYSQTRSNESVIKEIGFTFEWEGLTFLGCNASRYNSHLFTAGLKPEHDGCFGFKWTGKDWSVSLYGVPGKPDIDLSQIAVKYKGGGHKQACGFRTVQLPFLGTAGETPAAR